VRNKKLTKQKNSFVSDPIDHADNARSNLSPTNEHESSAADQSRSASQEATLDISAADDHQPTLDQIRYQHRQRRFAMESRKAQDLRLGAYLRMMLGWRKDLPAAERKAIEDRATAIVKKPEGTEWEYIVSANVAGQAPIVAVEKAALKKMEELAKTLPVWEQFGAGVRGFGAGSLATLLAEAGNLSNYPKKGHLWKRMGLAVMGDVRQGGLPKGSGAEAWIAHGYSPARRSFAWNIGDTMLKAQVRKVKSEDGEDTGERTSLGKYGALYLARKEYELARDPEIQPIKAHRRAQRVMEKRLLKDLWQAWRRASIGVAESPIGTLPDAKSMQIAA
jgi:hypothetical protein